jgi:sulfite reductase beta subunit-like hemoprotein
MPRKFKIAFDGCTNSDCTIAAIHNVGAKAVIRDGQRGFRVVIGGGLGPLPVEARILDEFLPEDRIVNRIEAVLRVFNQYGNRKNRNMARLKFVMRERGFEWLKEQVDKEYADILENGGIPTPTEVPEGFGGYTGKPLPLGNGAQLPVVNRNGSGDSAFDRWLESSVDEQKQTGYAMVTVKVQQGNMTSHQMREIAKIAAKPVTAACASLSSKTSSLASFSSPSCRAFMPPSKPLALVTPEPAKFRMWSPAREPTHATWL